MKSDREKVADILDEFSYRRGYPCGDTKTRDSYVDQILEALKPEGKVQQICSNCGKSGGCAKQTFLGYCRNWIIDTRDKQDNYKPKQDKIADDKQKFCWDDDTHNRTYQNCSDCGKPIAKYFVDAIRRENGKVG